MIRRVFIKTNNETVPAEQDENGHVYVRVPGSHESRMLADSDYRIINRPYAVEHWEGAPMGVESEVDSTDYYATLGEAEAAFDSELPTCLGSVTLIQRDENGMWEILRTRIHDFVDPHEQERSLSSDIDDIKQQITDLESELAEKIGERKIARESADHLDKACVNADVEWHR